MSNYSPNIITQAQRITLFIFFISINFEMFQPISGVELSVSRITGVLYFLTLIPDIKYFIRTDKVGDVLSLIWIFFGLLTVVSIINYNEFSKEFFNMTLFQNILLFWFLVNHARKDYLIIEKGLLFYGFGALIVAILFIAGIGVEYVGGRLSMFKENQNTLGVSMTIAILILSLAVLQDKVGLGRIRYIFLAFIPLMLNFVFATGSRLAFVAIITSLIAGVILLKTKNAANKFVVIVVGILILLGTGVMLMQHEVLRDRLLDSAQNQDLSSRDVIWTNLMPLIKENTLFGVGITGYKTYSLMTIGKYLSPHNVILEVICFTGLIGVIIYLTFIYRVFMTGYRVYRLNNLLLPVLLALPVVGSLLSGHILDRKIGWIIFAYVIGSSAIPRKSNAVVSSSKKIGFHEYSLRN